jgi:hypothetical protein
MGYHPRTNIVKDEKDVLVTDSRIVLGRWGNHFSQVSDVRQTDILTAEELLPELNASEVEMAIETLKRH